MHNFDIVILLLVVYIYFVFINRYTGKRKIDFILFFLIAFVCVLAPVLNIAMDSNWSIQTDRYSYVASPFFFLLLSFLLLYIKKDYVRYGIVCVLLFVSCVFLNQTNKSWREVGKLKVDIITNFPLDETRDIYLLNLPDNYQGAHFFRNGLGSALELHHKESIRKQIIEIVEVNFLTKEDSLTIDSNYPIYSIELPHWGRWIHKITNKEKDWYKITKTHDTGYTLDIKEQNEDAVFMYLNGSEWEYLN